MKNLIALSKFDEQLVEIDRKKKVIPGKIEQIKIKLQKGKSAFQLLEDNMLMNDTKKQKIDEEIKEFSVKVQAAKTKLYDIKTNEAYKMALKEIDNFEHEVKIREEEALKIMEYAEKNRPELETMKSTFKPEEEVLIKEEQLLVRELEELQEQAKKIIEERNKNIPQVDSRLYLQYEQIRKAKNGLGLILVNYPNCSGCNLGIRPQLYNELIKGDVKRCQNCGRLLYYIAPEAN